MFLQIKYFLDNQAPYMFRIIWQVIGKDIDELLYTCTTETKEIADPVKVGGLDNLDFGLAEYAAGEADRTFSTYNIKQL